MVFTKKVSCKVCKTQIRETAVRYLRPIPEKVDLTAVVRNIWSIKWFPEISKDNCNKV